MYLKSNIVFCSTHIGNERDTPSYLKDLLYSADLVVLENENMLDKIKLKIKNESEIICVYPKLLNNFKFDELIEEKQLIFDESLKTAIHKFQEYANKNCKIALLSDEGSSLIADFGNYFRNYCILNNLKYEVMAGPSAVINSLCSSGFVGDLDLFTFFGPRFSKKQIDIFINIVNSSLADNPGIVFMNQDNCLYLIEKLIDKLGNISGWLCIDLTTEKETVVGDNLLIIKDYIKNNLHETKYKASLVFVNKSLDMNHVYR